MRVVTRIYDNSGNRINEKDARKMFENISTNMGFWQWAELNFTLRNECIESPYERTRNAVYATGNKWAMKISMPHIIYKEIKIMIKMSFYKGTFNREKLIAFINETEKPIQYTYGFSYRHPTTHNKPIGKDEAIKIAKMQSLLDADEYEDRLHLNAFSDNDMWRYNNRL